MILALRLVAGAFVAVWAILLFGVIDLATALSWREGWEESLVLEASWGALFTFFMVVPLLVVAVRPGRYADAALWSGVTTVSLIGGAIITADATTLWLALAAVVTGGIVLALGLAGARRSGLPRPGRPGVQPSWLLGALALGGLPLWSAYAASAASVPPGAPTPYISVAFDHWPVQAAFGIAVALASVIAVVFVEARTLAVCAAALSAVVLGVVMALSQELPVATESPLWCIGAVLWGALLALGLHAAPFTGFSPAQASAAASAPNAERPPEGGRS